MTNAINSVKKKSGKGWFDIHQGIIQNLGCYVKRSPGRQSHTKTEVKERFGSSVQNVFLTKWRWNL